MREFIQDIIKKIYLTFIVDDRYLFFVEGLRNTMILTLTSFIFGTLFGIILCALQRSKNPFFQKSVKVITAVFVEMPTMVLLMILVYIIFGRTAMPVLWTVIIGLTLKAGSYLSEIFNSALSTVSDGEIEAARTLGMNKYQAFFYVVLPQSINAALPLYINQFIVSMQETSVVGYLAIVDLTRAASIISSRTMDAFFGIIFVTIVYFIIGYFAKLLLNILGKRNRERGVA